MLKFKFNMHIQVLAIEVLQEAAKAILVMKFESKYILCHDFYQTNLHINIVTNIVTINARRVTIQTKDMQVVRRLREIMTKNC